MICEFIPPYLLERLGRSDEVDADIRSRRSTTRGRPSIVPTTGRAWQVHDAQNGSALPGELVRSEGDAEVADVSVNEAATGIAETLALYADYGRSSYDDRGATVVASVHYEKDYDNAFWDGTQLVFGDGDGEIFGSFTAPIDVLGHELTHALVEFTANLTYEGQSGALNESISDVFGVCMKQRHLGHSADSADWLVGEGIFLPGINGRALRSMESPGTAYDDPQIGKDPQVGHFDDYVMTTDDNGGVHLNSGIPNRAFVLAAKAIGGESWSGAGQVWYAALTSGLAADTGFAAFAAATVAAAGEHVDAVSQAWAAVGVTPSAVLGQPAGSASASSGHSVEVVRTGGLAGLRKEGSVDLDSDDPRAPQARELVHRIDFAAVPPAEPQPDRYTYRFCHGRDECTLGETALTPDHRTLADLVLGEPGERM